MTILVAPISRNRTERRPVGHQLTRPLTIAGGKRTQSTEKKRSAKVTRQLRLLRAHGLVHKVPKTQRYQVSPKGKTLLTALAAARAADTVKLQGAA